jgi:hypothetical protein
MITRLEPEIQELVQKLCRKILSQSGGDVFDVAMAYSCFATDAISGYSFGESFGLLDQKGWFPNFREPTAAVLQPVFIFRFFPWTKSSVGLAKPLISYLPPDIAMLVRFLQVDMPNKVLKTKADMLAGINYDRPTIFASLLQADFDRDTQELTDEACAVVNAGTETVSNVGA